MTAIPQADIVRVRVLSTAGCPHTPATIAAIEEAAREASVPVQLQTVLIETQEEAEAQRFLGSPTVQINGVDLDPQQRDRTDFGFM